MNDYPRRGFGQIVEALAGAAIDTGAQLRLGTEADRVVPAEDGVTVCTRHGQTLTAGYLFTSNTRDHSESGEIRQN
ncbi:MAG TPA: hypothetical protein VJT72_07680 [Pseudonocardiaceae bacterium]|nr:hypothetical protein [Pseudonocardiaceae bacterium]